MSEIEPMTHGDDDHEKSDIDVRRVAVYGSVALLAICLVGILVTVVTFKNLARETETNPVSPLYQPDQLPPEPRLQVNPRLDMKMLRAEEETRLNSFHWVNRANGIVGVPIDRALDFVSRQGLPARPDSSIEPTSAPGEPSAATKPAPRRAVKGRAR